MAHAEICLICCGKGKLPDDGKSTAVYERPCYGCGGLGWVTVEDMPKDTFEMSDELREGLRTGLGGD